MRAFLGLAAGAAIAFGAVYGWQLLGHLIFPFPVPMDPADPLNREVLVGSMPFPAKAWVVGGYAVGVAAGGFIGNLIADARWPAIAIAVMVAGAFFATLTVTPHPLWMQALGLVLPLAAGLAIAAKVGRRTLEDL